MVPRAIPCSAGKAFINPTLFARPARGARAPPGRGAVRCAPFPAGARARAPSARRLPALRGEAGRGGGAGPSARGAGGTRDHAARGWARSAARWRRRGEQWRPRPPDGRVRCWCCCGGCRCCGAAAGLLASAARTGPPVAVQSLRQPRHQAETQVSALSARGRSQTMGAAGGLLPCTRDPPGCVPATPRDSRPCPCPGDVGSAWPPRGLWGGVPAGTVGTLPEEPALGVRRFGSHAREPADGLRPGNLPRAWDLLIPFLLPAQRHPVPGSRGRVPAAAGAERDLAVWDLRRRPCSALSPRRSCIALFNLCQAISHKLLLPQF